MKKKLLVVLISSIMGLQLVGCGSSNNSSDKSTYGNKAVSTTHNKLKVINNDRLTNNVSEVYLQVKEEFEEVFQNKEINQWNDCKTKALENLKEIKKITPKSDKNINQSIEDIEQLIDNYQNILDGNCADPIAIQNLESQIEQLLFDK
ncbi:hypothetical protein [Clostridium sp.]|uniref:hypothetical protein n=1 Tax=Clostridium sp. TaxID=1506 RepID=UPI002622F236